MLNTFEVIVKYDLWFVAFNPAKLKNSRKTQYDIKLTQTEPHENKKAPNEGAFLFFELILVSLVASSVQTAWRRLPAPASR